MRHSLLLVLALATAARADTLFRGVTVLPQEGAAFEGDVLVVGDKVVDFGPHLDPEKPVTVVDGNGRFLIPGLIDAHAHVAEETIFPDLFVPHGVTTVRDMGNRLELIQRLSRERSPARPEFVYVGPILDGNPPVWPTISEVLEDPKDVAPLLARLKKDGCRWFKVYEKLKPEVYDAIVAEARNLGVPVIGHVPMAVGVLHCVESGQRTIEHLDHFSAALSKKVGDLSFTQEISSWGDVDPEKETKLIASLKAHETELDPTFLVIRNISLLLRGKKPETEAEKFVPKSLKDTFWAFFTTTETASDELEKAHEASLARAREFVKKASDAGVPILCGSDTPNPYVVPGASVLEEVEELAKALGPTKALECATLANARALGRADLGRIAKGTRADLVLLAKDPRKDARALRSIEAVMVRGELHDKKWIEGALAKLEERARSQELAVATGFESIPGALSDRKPLTAEWRFEGRLGTYPASFWVRARAFNGPEEGSKMFFLRAAGSVPIPIRVAEDMLVSKDGQLARFHMSMEAMGPRRETTIERGEKSWRVQLFSNGEIKEELTVPLDETPSARGQLLFLQMVSGLDLEEGASTARKLRFVDLDRMKVLDAVEWTIRRKKNPVTDEKDPRSRGRYFTASSEDPSGAKLGAWIGESGEPLGFEIQVPFGKFVLGRVLRKYY